MTREQSLTARALLGWSQEELAFHSGLSIPTIRILETFKQTPSAYSLQALERTFERAGIEFTSDEPSGVRLKRS